MLFLAKVIVTTGNGGGGFEWPSILVRVGERSKLDVLVSWGNDLLWLCFGSVHASVAESVLTRRCAVTREPQRELGPLLGGGQAARANMETGRSFPNLPHPARTFQSRSSTEVILFPF